MLNGRWGRLLVWGAAVPALVAAGWVAARHFGRDRDELPPEGSAARHDPVAVVVTAEPVTFRAVQRTIEAVGTLHGFEEVTIAAKVEGRVRRLHHDVADPVRPGALLLEIDPTDAELAVEQAERALEVELARLGLQQLPREKIELDKLPTVMQAQSRLDNARSRYDRVRRMAAGSRSVPAEELDNATSDIRTAQAEHAHQLLMARAAAATARLKQAALATARQQLADTRVLAPTPTLPVPGAEDGVRYAVTHRHVAEGTLVRPGTELFRLVIPRTLKLRVPVPERHTGEVHPGQVVEVHAAAADRPAAGIVSRVNPGIDSLTRTFEVEIHVPNADGRLKPGGFARAAIRTRRDDGAATVPLTAIVQFAGVTKLFLADAGRAREVQVRLGVQTADWVEIIHPTLPRRSLAITSGQTVLAADSKVTLRDASTPTAVATRQTR